MKLWIIFHYLVLMIADLENLVACESVSIDPRCIFWCQTGRAGYRWIAFNVQASERWRAR